MDPTGNGNPRTVNSAEEPNGLTCFVIMPITDPEGYEVGHFRPVFDDLFVPT